MDIYLLIDGQQQGPYTKDRVRQSLAEGLIPADLPAWHEGLEDWVQVATLIQRPEEGVPEPENHSVEPPVLVPPIQPSKSSGLIYLTAGLATVAVGAIGCIGAARMLHKKVPSPEVTVPAPQVVASQGVAPQVASAESSAPPPAIPESNAISTNVSTPPVERADSGDTSQNMDKTADIEKARSFIEKQLAQHIVYADHKRHPSVRIEQSTGHIYIDYIDGTRDCLLGALDEESIAERGAGPSALLVIETKGYEKCVKTTSRLIGPDPVNLDRIELIGVPNADRVAEAFRFLISAYSTTEQQDSSASATIDVRDTLCGEIRKAYNASSDIRKFEVSYDKSQEAFIVKCLYAEGLYSEAVFPVKSIDPQAIKWTQSGTDPGKLRLVAIDNSASFQTKYNQDTNYSPVSSYTFTFPTEDDAAQFSDTVRQLCTELGWKPSKF